MPQSQNRKLTAILFADKNERFLAAGRNESLVDFQVREQRSGWADTSLKTKCNNGK